MPKPTPTQEENDLAMMGAHVMVKEHDGSAYENPDTPPPPQADQELPRVVQRPRPEPSKKKTEET